jgi:hypothetical protein
MRSLLSFFCGAESCKIPDHPLDMATPREFEEVREYFSMK